MIPRARILPSSLVQKLDRLPPPPTIAVRPAEISHREAERLGLFEQWEAENPSRTLYWDVLWAYDEVEACDAWWVNLPDPPPQPVPDPPPQPVPDPPPQPGESAARTPGYPEWWSGSPGAPVQPPTPGRLLHRLPDPHVSRVYLAVEVEAKPGEWQPLPGGDLDPEDARRLVSFEIPIGWLWPAFREIRLTVSQRTDPNGKLIVPDADGRGVARASTA